MSAGLSGVGSLSLCCLRGQESVGIGVMLTIRSITSTEDCFGVATEVINETDPGVDICGARGNAGQRNRRVNGMLENAGRGQRRSACVSLGIEDRDALTMRIYPWREVFQPDASVNGHMPIDQPMVLHITGQRIEI